MADNSKMKSAPNEPGTNPNVSSRDGAINPSATTAGTEGWGNTTDEREMVDMHDPAGTRAGQMKGNPGDNQAEMSHRMSESAFSANTTHGGADRTFRCADMGNSDCRWEISGASDDEIVNRVYEHAKDEHGLSDWTEALHSRVRNHIRDRNAA